MQRKAEAQGEADSAQDLRSNQLLVLIDEGESGSKRDAAQNFPKVSLAKSEKTFLDGDSRIGVRESIDHNHPAGWGPRPDRRCR
jgi:hypothetical protein